MTEIEVRLLSAALGNCDVCLGIYTSFNQSADPWIHLFIRSTPPLVRGVGCPFVVFRLTLLRMVLCEPNREPTVSTVITVGVRGFHSVAALFHLM